MKLVHPSGASVVVECDGDLLAEVLRPLGKLNFVAVAEPVAEEVVEEAPEVVAETAIAEEEKPARRGRKKKEKDSE